MSPSEPTAPDEGIEYAESADEIPNPPIDDEGIEYAESADELAAVDARVAVVSAPAQPVYEVTTEPVKPYVDPPGWRDRPEEYGLTFAQAAPYAPAKEYAPPPSDPYDVSFADHRASAAPVASTSVVPHADPYAVRDSEPAGAGGGPSPVEPDAPTAPILTGRSEDAFARRVEADGRFPEKTVTWDLDCIRCGYNLKTMPETARCPECGTPVRWSMADLLDPVSAGRGVRFTAIARLAALLIAPIDATGPGLWVSAQFASKLDLTAKALAIPGVVAGLATVAFTMYAVRRVRNSIGGRCIVDYGDEASKLKWTLVGELIAGGVASLLAALMFLGPGFGNLADILGYSACWLMTVMLPWPIISALRNRWMCVLWSELSAGASRTDLGAVFEILGKVHAWGVFAGVLTVCSLFSYLNTPQLTILMGSISAVLLIGGQIGMVVTAFLLAGALHKVGMADGEPTAPPPQAARVRLPTE